MKLIIGLFMLAISSAVLYSLCVFTHWYVRNVPEFIVGLIVGAALLLLAVGSIFVGEYISKKI